MKLNSIYMNEFLIFFQEKKKEKQTNESDLSKNL